jgi:sugar phosphate isomerase/epimerase
MSSLLERRDFLKTTAAVAVGSLARPSRAAGNGPGVPAEPRPRLFPGCCAYSYRKFLEKGPMTMEDFILKAVELGVVGVEVTTYYLKSSEPAYLAGLRRMAYRQGMPLLGLSIGTQMCQSDTTKRQEAVDAIRKWVDATDLLGASHLRVFGDKVPPGTTETQGVEWVAETLKSACDYAAKKGVILGLESHGGLTSKAANILEILRRVDSPFAGCTLDVANFPENPYEHIEACVPYATHSHIRDSYGQPKKPLDLERVWSIFAKAGYKGFMSAEYEGDEDPTTGVPKLVEKIKTLCRKYSTA